MDIDQSSPPPPPPQHSSSSSITLFEPFPRRSVTLLLGPTSSGKTYFLHRILEQSHLYFSPSPVSRIVVVLCNDRVPPYHLNQEQQHPAPQVVQVTLDDFEPEFLEPDDILVIEDLQTLTPPLRDCINVLTHHLDLRATLVVAHSLLGNKNFELLSLVHRTLFFLGSTGVSRAARFVVRDFFQDAETRAYLKSVIGFCERLKVPLLIETNTLASAQLGQLALSHLLQWIKGYSLVYPQVGMQSVYETSQASPDDQLQPSYLDTFDAEATLASSSSLPSPTFVVFPAQALLKQKSRAKEATTAAETKESCAEKEAWESVTEMVEEMIENYFPAKKLMQVRNLAREILSHPKICLSTDARMLHLKKVPKTKVPLLDFLTVATRPLGPSEQVHRPEYQSYSKLARALLERGAPQNLIKNKFLVMRQPKQQQQPKKKKKKEAYLSYPPYHHLQPHQLHPRKNY